LKIIKFNSLHLLFGPGNERIIILYIIERLILDSSKIGQKWQPLKP